ncbi:mitochondrial pyruvate carrier 2-like [Leptidea sinapis]|uniref:mitochondrial pyruvate carrier 2-like n=1 Tax=Leptidea sinapis TaxID=189913 RepID=UPI0021C2FAC0|nr:mitochondrial pyruvate carrier 2-like [Leptidea sinapis]
MSKIYRTIIAVADRFVPGPIRPLWNHPAGPKTIFFWAPAFKWSLVIAGLGDITRPVETISTSQTLSLAVTGMIWSRYSLVIVPKNYSLFAVNIVVVFINCYQLARLYSYQKAV